MRVFQFLSVAFLANSIFVFSASTSVAQSATPTPADDERPVRISTALIQIDVQVTGKDGKPVTGLTAGDFTLLQDGREQQLSSVTYVDERSGMREPVFQKSGKDRLKTAPPPSNVRSRQGRIITFVLDDGNCLATLDGKASMRDAVRKFIETQMQPDDRVAIYRTAGGSSLMQPYTSNREVLRRLANKISFLPSRSCGTTFDALRDQSTISIRGTGVDSFESEADRERRNATEARDRRNQVVGTVGVLSFVVDRIRDIPQRKTIFLLSEGVIADLKDDTFDRLRDLADKAARASVTIHTMSTKGLTVPGQLTAQDEVLPGIIGGQDNTTPASEARIREERALNEGLAFLADQTGGRFVRNQNRLEKAVDGILDSQAAYYLLAYEPEGETFRGKGFHRIEIRTSRPDTVVTTRKGFFGRVDADTRPVYKSPDSPLYQAISSPFSESGLDVRLTLLYANDEKAGSYLRALLYIPGGDLALVPDGAGKKISMDVVAVILDEKGKVVEEFNRAYAVKFPQQGVATVERNGIDFSTDLPVRKPGIYTVRLAVRNNNSNRVGSAGDVVELPKLDDRDLFLSGLVTTSLQPNGLPLLPERRPVNASFGPVYSTEMPAVRRYPRGSTLAYAYSIYNAKKPSGSQRADVTKTIKLFREGTEIVSTLEEPVRASTLPNRIDDHGTMRISSSVQAGEYVLQVIVRDRTTNKVSSQWIDFEVID